MTEELRPCLHHGDITAMVFSSVSKEYAACEKCSKGELWFRPIEAWNNAWGWKEIDRLKEEKINLEIANHTLQASIDGEMVRADKLKSQNKKMRKTLEKYGRHQFGCACGPTDIRIKFTNKPCGCGFEEALTGE